MKRNDLLAQLSLISLVLMLMHLPDDFVHGLDKTVVNSPFPILIFVVWGCGLFLFRERMIGRIILLLGGLMAVGMPIIHLRGHFPPEFAASEGAFRFITTLYAVGTTGSLTIILALRELLKGSTPPHQRSEGS